MGQAGTPFYMGKASQIAQLVCHPSSRQPFGHKISRNRFSDIEGNRRKRDFPDL
jgi:hypothetical protein